MSVVGPEKEIHRRPMALTDVRAKLRRAAHHIAETKDYIALKQAPQRIMKAVQTKPCELDVAAQFALPIPIDHDLPMIVGEAIQDLRTALDYLVYDLIWVSIPLTTVIDRAIIPPYRLPRRALGERWNMRVDPMFVDCVAFLCARDRQGTNVPGGTAFFVEVPDEDDPQRTWTYLVTALHCLDESPGRNIYVRVKTLPNVIANRDYEDKETRKSDWFPHWNADVAAILAPYDPARHAIQQLHIDLFIDSEYRLNINAFNGRGNSILEPMLRAHYANQGGIPVELGHELFFPGLFLQSAGKRQILPIVRFGNISRMPGEELVRIKGSSGREKEISAYLAEFHSWGGHSGSPVLWHYEYNVGLALNVPLWRDPPKSRLLIDPPPEQPQRVEVQIKRGYVMGLLGLISAHFDIDTPAKDKRSEKIEDIRTGINAGTAIITPAENIRELLMSDEMKEDRQKRVAEMDEQEPVATMDYAGKRPRKTRDVEIPPISRQQFMRDLTKATKRKPH